MYQRYFSDFYRTIKADNINENDVLRDRIYMVKDNINEYLMKNALPNFQFFNLGSYAVNTAVKPVDGKYNVDLGICFDIMLEDYENYRDPIEVKKWIQYALESSADEVQITRYGVTAQYKNEGQAAQVNIAVYANNLEEDKYYIAMGKPYSMEENKMWQLSNPKDVMEKIVSHYTHIEHKEQFIRIISYLKRYKDLKFTSKGISASLGFGITMFALEYLDLDKNSEDLTVLKNFVDTIVDKFQIIKDDEMEIERLRYTLPMEPENDLFSEMSDLQMDYFKRELRKLSNILGEVKENGDALEGCMLLQEVFGSEFPVPEEESTRNSAYAYA